MTVYDFCSLCTEECRYNTVVSIWDFVAEDVVFVGTMQEAEHSEFANYLVHSFDVCEKREGLHGVIEFNIDTWEGERA